MTKEKQRVLKKVCQEIMNIIDKLKNDPDNNTEEVDGFVRLQAELQNIDLDYNKLKHFSNGHLITQGNEFARIVFNCILPEDHNWKIRVHKP